MLGIERLSVHGVGDDGVVERFLDRHGAGHRRGVGALRQQPLGVGLETGFFEQALERDARVHDAVDHAVGELTAVELRALPLHAGIGRAFEERDPVDAGEALDVLQRQHQRLLDEAVDHQPMLGRIDLGDAAMVALEAQAVRGDDSLQLVQRREADRTLARGGQPFDVAADHVHLELRRAAVGPADDTLTERLRPFRYARRKVLRVRRGGCAARKSPRADRSAEGEAGAQEGSSRGWPGRIGARLRFRHRPLRTVSSIAMCEYIGDD